MIKEQVNIKSVFTVLAHPIMEQMKVNPNAIVNIEDLPPAAAILQPVVFQEGDIFCCLLGPDPQEGVFGCGDTPHEAIEDWEDSLRTRVNEARAGDVVALEIVDTLQAARLAKEQKSKAEIDRFFSSFIKPKAK